MSERYDGREIVGLDLHRHRTVMARMTPAGEGVEAARFANDAGVLAAPVATAGPGQVWRLEAGYGVLGAVGWVAQPALSVQGLAALGGRWGSVPRVETDARGVPDVAD